MYISNFTCTAYVHNIMSVSSPLYCFQVQVCPVITKGECTVGGCSDWSISGCSLLTLQMDLQGVDKCGHLILRYWFWSSTHMMMVCTSCHVSVHMCVCVCVCVCVSFWTLHIDYCFCMGEAWEEIREGGKCVWVWVWVWERERDKSIFL